MTKEELGQLYPIQLKPYNSEWINYFAQEKELLKSYFAQGLVIEHIGSTAIHGLMSKPTIDILIQRPSILDNQTIIKIFNRNNYIHMKEQNNHFMFVKGYTPTGLDDISYHIHMGPLNQDWLWDRIYFRDYLNQNNDYKHQYQDLKILLAEKYKHDREAYTNSKSDFIIKVTEEAKNLSTQTAHTRVR